MLTLKSRCETEDFGFARSNFIDDFSNNPSVEMIEDSILDISTMNDVQKSILAATVDEMCSKYNIDRPAWIYDKSTFLAKPYFAMRAKGKLRLVLLKESPRWYRARNLFVTANCSERI